MEEEQSLFKLILRLLDNKNTLRITVLSALASAAISAIFYLCHEKTLLQWNIIPSTVNNPYESWGLHIIIIIGAYCSGVVLSQIYLQNKLDYLVGVAYARKETLRILKSTTIKCPSFNGEYIKNEKTYRKHARKIVSSALMKMIPALLIIAVVVCASTLFFGSNSVPPHNMLTFINIILWPCLLELFMPPGYIIEVKKTIRASQGNPARLQSAISMAHTKPAQSSYFQLKVLSAVFTLIVCIVLVFITCFMAGPMSVRKTTNFWIAEGEQEGIVYVVPYISDDTGVAKEAILDNDRICINLSSQINLNIKDKMLRHKTFKQVYWEEYSCTERITTIYNIPNDTIQYGRKLLSLILDVDL